MASLFLFASLSTLAILCCNADLVDDICAKSIAISPTSCTETLRSNPRSRGTDLQTLGQILIEKGKAATKDTATVARAVLDRNNSGAVRVCNEVCRTAIDELNNISKIMMGHIDDVIIISNLRNSLSAVVTFIETCNDAFVEGVDGEPPEVKEAATIAQALVHLLFVIIGAML